MLPALSRSYVASTPIMAGEWLESSRSWTLVPRRKIPGKIPGAVTESTPWEREIMYQRILVPLDGSELAERVLPHAISLAKALGVGVTLLRTNPYPIHGGMEMD